MTDSGAPVTGEGTMLEALAEKVSNWGRWGATDQAGALNFVEPGHIVAAASAVTLGVTVTLQLPIRNGYGPQARQSISGRVNPIHMVSAASELGNAALGLGPGVFYSDDYLILPTQAGSQWDSLSHLGYDHRMYNGVPADAVDAHGAARCDIGGVSEKFVARGVLLDVAGAKGLDELEPGYAITVDDLVEAEEFGKVRAGAGDIVIVRTGALGAAVRTGRWDRFNGPQPGLHYATAEWIADRRLAAVAADNSALEASGVLDEYRLPLHMLLLRDMGVHIGELWLLDELSQTCARHAKYDMFLAAQPLRIAGGVGSPVNPIAIL